MTGIGLTSRRVLSALSFLLIIVGLKKKEYKKEESPIVESARRSPPIRGFFFGIFRFSFFAPFQYPFCLERVGRGLPFVRESR